MYPRDLAGLIFAVVLALTPLIVGAALLLRHFGWIN